MQPTGCQLHGAVAIETTLGTITIGLYGKDCPQNVRNFLLLGALRYYHGTRIGRVLRDSFFEIRGHESVVGDVTGEYLLDAMSMSTVAHHDQKAAASSSSACKVVPLEIAHQVDGPLCPATEPSGEQQRLSKKPVRIGRRGQVVMMGQSTDPETGALVPGCRGAFLVTTSDKRMEYLDKKHVLLGEVVDGMDVIRRINALALKNSETVDGEPIRKVFIKHFHVIDDPFGIAGDKRVVALRRSFVRFLNSEVSRKQSQVDDEAAKPASCCCPVVDTDARGDGLSSPIPNPTFFFAADDDNDVDDLTATLAEGQQDPIARELKEVERRIRKKRDDETQQIMMKLIGERPKDGDEKPPDNVLFVCKLNPLTLEDDLGKCFEQFGPVLSCDIVKDKKTGRSLQYAFITFATAEACTLAYRKMDRVKIDESRIHVDFSQSLGKMYWQSQRDKRARVMQQQQRPDTQLPRRRTADKMANDGGPAPVYQLHHHHHHHHHHYYQHQQHYYYYSQHHHHHQMMYQQQQYTMHHHHHHHQHPPS